MPPPPDPQTFRAAMSAVPTAVTVITATVDGEPLGATANAVVSLSVDPPLMLVALDRRSRTLGALQSEGRFGVCVLSAGQGELALRFATKEPHPVKWEGVPWRDVGGVPGIEEAMLVMACELREELDGGDHAVVVGSVTEMAQSDLEPLVFHQGSYRGLQ
jgi:3-hydroxy-9,10-secoandrosta-1,3,5(10)-triene-9,17-dione monooxygenase reductase component